MRYARFHSYFFFFSSRRRHTRCSRDWSSDVCSSDLAPMSMVETVVNLKPESEWRPGMTQDRLVAEMDQRLRLTGDQAILGDRKSTRLNSSHGYISYAVFCLKKTTSGDRHLRHGILDGVVVQLGS